MFALLEAIVAAAQDEESIVLDKEELISEVKGLTMEDLKVYVEELKENEFIDVKYSNDSLYVFAPQMKGRVAVEKTLVTGNKPQELAPIVRKALYEQEPSLSAKRIAYIAFAASFLGGLFASIIGFIIARFS